MTDHCAGCGYLRKYHSMAGLRCPVTTKAGKQIGKWKDRPEIDYSDFRQIMRRDYLARKARYDEAHKPYQPPTIYSPQVPARPPYGPTEVAGYQGRQALGLGRRATAAGWLVRLDYARAHDGAEMSAIKLQHENLRAVATWERGPGNIGKPSGWSVGVAYAWRAGEMPAKVNHSDLEAIFK